MEKKEIAVSNTSSLIFIGKLGIIDLIKNYFDYIIIPRQVYNEIINKDSSEVIYIKKELGEFIKIIDVKNILNLNIGEGERSAISLCLEKDIKKFISDDKNARKYAQKLSIDTIGIIGIIILNLESNRITKDDAKMYVNELINKGLRISTFLYADVLRHIESF